MESPSSLDLGPDNREEQGEPLSFWHSSHHGLCWLRHRVGLSLRVGTLMDPAAESGEGREHRKQEGLTRNICSLSPAQMDGLNTNTPFIPSLAKSMFIGPRPYCPRLT